MLLAVFAQFEVLNEGLEISETEQFLISIAMQVLQKVLKHKLNTTSVNDLQFMLAIQENVLKYLNIIPMNQMANLNCFYSNFVVSLLVVLHCLPMEKQPREQIVGKIVEILGIMFENVKYYF